MDSAKRVLFLAVILLLTVGYAASQWAWWTGDFANYAKRVDVPAVQHAALVVLILLILSAIFWDKRADKGA